MWRKKGNAKGWGLTLKNNVINYKYIYNYQLLRNVIGDLINLIVKHHLIISLLVMEKMEQVSLHYYEKFIIKRKYF